jgi:drug/metabolite transporter (DMT)-like permease
MFFFGSFVFASLHRSAIADSERPSSGQSWLPAIVYGLALAGGDTCFILATHRIPAAQANLISYLWPVMIVVLGAAMGLFRLRLRQIIGLALGFIGAAILIWDRHVAMSLSGIGLALLSGACWATYCIFRLTWKQPAGRQSARQRMRLVDSPLRAPSPPSGADRDAKPRGTGCHGGRRHDPARARKLRVGRGI